MEAATSPANKADQATEKTPVELEQPTVDRPEILVIGSKVLNMDIKRSRDDPQPYVVLDRAKIEQSGAANLEDFLKSRLPMNTVGVTESQFSADGLQGSPSQIN